MSSLTTALLFNAPFDLPKGRKRTHYIDGRKSSTHEKTNHGSKLNYLIREANIDTVLMHVKNGTNEILKIVAATGIGVTTVQKALIALEERGMVTRKIGGKTHRFFAINTEVS